MLKINGNHQFLYTKFQHFSWIEKRVKHLMGERMDYKAYYYKPVTSEWLELGGQVILIFERQCVHKILGVSEKITLLLNFPTLFTQLNV